jgi:Na+/H+-dicarboxylate symporter
MKKLLKNLGIWILIAMIIGIVVGSLMGPDASAFKPLGDLFIQLIKMLVVPLVLVSIISGAASLGETKSAGLVGGISIAYMLMTTAISIVIAIILGVVFKPGESANSEAFNKQTYEYMAADNKDIYIDVNNDGSTLTSLSYTIEAKGISEAKWLVYNINEKQPSLNEVMALGNAIDLTQETTIEATELDAGTKYNIVVAATTEGGESVVTTPLENNTLPAPMGFWDTIIDMIPDNPIRALTEGNILQIIIFGLFLGFGISSLATERRRKVVGGLNTILEALIWCIGKVMYVAPFGVFGLIADATGTFGIGTLAQIANVLWLDLIAVAIILFGLYPFTIAMFSRVPLKTYFRAMLKPQIVSFSTASSLATLPVNMEACDEMGISKQTSGFVLPLGATINMAGNAIYYALLAIFFAQFYDVDLGMAEYVSITIVCTLGAIGQAGVPGPTLLAAAVLVAAGIPLEGLPLFYALDRIFDMIRTTLNITGDAACAAVVDRFVKR